MKTCTYAAFISLLSLYPLPSFAEFDCTPIEELVLKGKGTLEENAKTVLDRLDEGNSEIKGDKWRDWIKPIRALLSKEDKAKQDELVRIESIYVLEDMKKKSILEGDANDIKADADDLRKKGVSREENVENLKSELLSNTAKLTKCIRDKSPLEYKSMKKALSNPKDMNQQYEDLMKKLKDIENEMSGDLDHEVRK